jgi:hypothetical protein
MKSMRPRLRCRRRHLGHQQLLQIFPDDRLAPGLDGHSRGLCARHRKAGAEPDAVPVNTGSIRRAGRLSSRKPSPSSKPAEPNFANAGISSHRRWSASASGSPPARKAPSISIAIARGWPTTASLWPATCSKPSALPPHPVLILAAMPRKSTSALPTPPASTVWPRPSSG